MEKIIILLGVVFLTCGTVANGQTSQGADSAFVKASYLKGHISNVMRHNSKYPIEAAMNKVQGDVIASFVIDAEGKLDDIAIVSSPGKSLSKSVITALNKIKEEWRPSENEKPIAKQYLIVFMFRTYEESIPPTYKSKAEKYLQKEKYEKALKYFDKAIIDNQYDYFLFESRSELKEILGDQEGAKQDDSTSMTLKNEIISVIEINSVGIKRTKSVVKYSIEKVYYGDR